MQTGNLPDGLKWYRAVAWGFAISCVGYAGYGTWHHYADPQGLDFVSFWAAAKLALQGTPALAYDIAAHRSVELSVGPVPGLMPFAYPPPFLLMILPLGLPPFWLAFALWVTVTGLFYALATRSLITGPYALANPAAHLNALNGQNGFLMTGLFIGGTALLERRPVAAGAVLGLLCIKPQLAVLIPVALIAARQWRAIAAGAGSAAALILLGALAFGVDSYLAFFERMPTFVDALRANRLPMHLLASVYALMRYFHCPESVSIAVHAAVAATAVVATWLAWRHDSPARVPILAAASLLISPYIYIYDTLLLTVPMAYLLLRGDGRWVAAIWALALLSLAQILVGVPIPNLISVAAILCLWALRGDVAWRREALPNRVKFG